MEAELRATVTVLSFGRLYSLPKDAMIGIVSLTTEFLAQVFPQRTHNPVSASVPISTGLSFLFLPERDYVTFGSLLSQFRLSSVCLSVCLSSVCNVGAPYSGGWTFRQYFFTAVYAAHPLTSVQKFYGGSPRGTSLLGALNARGVSKYSDFRPIEGYIS